MDKKRDIAMGIALQTQALKTCAVHNQVYGGDLTDTEDETIARAFSLAVELVRRHEPYASEFHEDTHELTDLLSAVLSQAPESCPDWLASRYAADACVIDQSNAGGAFR